MKLSKSVSKPVTGMLILSNIVVTLLSVSPAWSNESQQQATQEFSIPAQPLNEAINSFIETTDWQVGFVTAQTKGVKSKAVQGEYTKEQALKKLLQGTDIQYRFVEENSITLQKRSANEFSTEMLLAQAPKENYPATVIDAEYSGPVEQEDLTVSGRELNGYSVINSSTGTKTDTLLMETPMSVQVVPKAVLEDQQVIRLQDAVKNVSGVVTGFGFGTLEDTFIIRGFENSTSNWGLTQIYRDGALSTGGLFSTVDIERIEVLKGPAAMLYGRLEPGGFVNVVTKRPQAEAAYYIQQQFGSYDTYRTTAGATGALNDDDSLTYRLDFEYLDKNSFRDFTFNEQVHVSPKLTWKVTDQTQIDLEYQYFKQETIIDWGIPVIGKRPADIPLDRFLGEATDQFPKESHSGGITVTHNFNDDWKIQAKYFKFSDQYSHTSGAGGNFPRSLNENTGELTRRFAKSNHDFNSDFVMLNLTGKFSTWGVDHNLLIGGDWFDSSFTEDGIKLNLGDVGGPARINIFNPVYGNGGDPVAGQTTNSYTKVDDKWLGFYLQDQITIAEDWHLLAGFRFDHAESKSSFAQDRSGVEQVNNELSPRVGLLYQALPWLSVYGSYMQGFNGPAGGRTVDGSALGPNRSRQYEGGFKTEWFDGKLSSTLVYYHLTKDNIRTPHTDPVLAQQGFTQQTGEARSQGIELDIQGQIAENWDIIGSYAYTDVEITKDSGRDGGKGNQGNRLFGVPKHSGSLWAYHKFGEFALPNLSAGMGVFAVGQREGDLANSFQLPGYARLDASIKYKQSIGSTNLTVQFNVQNLLDKEYYAAARPNRVGVTPGEPITFLGSVRLDF